MIIVIISGNIVVNPLTTGATTCAKHAVNYSQKNTKTNSFARWRIYLSNRCVFHNYPHVNVFMYYSIMSGFMRDFALHAEISWENLVERMNAYARTFLD